MYFKALSETHSSFFALDSHSGHNPTLQTHLTGMMYPTYPSGPRSNRRYGGRNNGNSPPMIPESMVLVERC